MSEKVGFVQINQRLLSANIPPTAKLIQIILISFLFRKKTCFPSISLISKLANVSENSVRKHIVILEENGFLEIVRQSGRSHFYKPKLGLVENHNSIESQKINQNEKIEGTNKVDQAHNSLLELLDKPQSIEDFKGANNE